MLFKEKLLLSNCDSVRQLNVQEIRKRFLTALTFADGVVLTPNTLIDNADLYSLITQKNIVKYLNEEGLGKFIVRGFYLDEAFSLVDYFKKLPSDYILSCLPNTPKKSEINAKQLDLILNRLDLMQSAMDRISPKIESIDILPDALKNEILKKINCDEAVGDFFNSDGERLLFHSQIENISSRSQWYEISNRYFGKRSVVESNRFKLEIIDPAYNSLYALKGEGFLQDNIKMINNIPEILLDTGVVFRSLRQEIKYLEYSLKAFELISSYGAGELAKFLTDEALGYIEDKFSDKGKNLLSRKNWFGMYDVMKKKIGLEVK